MPRSALSYPAQQSAYTVIAIFTVGGSLLTWLERFAVHAPALYVFAAHALMLPAWFAILGQLHCYGAFLMRAVARGHDEPPTPPTGALNPFQSIAIPIVLGAVALTASSVAYAIAASGAAWFIALPLVAVAPAFVAAVALADNAPSGLDPRAASELMVRSGAAYGPLAAAICAGYGALFAAMWYAERLFVPFALAAASYAFLVAQVGAGAALFARRNELRIETDFSPEQDVANAVAEREHELDELLTELHRLAAVDRNRQAYVRLDAYLARDRYRNDARVYEALRQFQGRDLRLEHACHYLERLVAARNAPTAWTVCKRSLDEDDLFRPLNDTSAIAVVAQASDADAHYAAMLLDDFVRAYPNSSLHPNALFRLAQLKIDRLDARTDGLELLAMIERDYPRFAGLVAFRDYADHTRADSRAAR